MMTMPEELQDRIFSFVLDRQDEIIVHLRKNNLAHRNLNDRVEEMLGEIDTQLGGVNRTFVKELVSAMELRDMMENKQCYMQGLKDSLLVAQFLGDNLLDKYYACHVVMGVPDGFA